MFWVLNILVALHHLLHSHFICLVSWAEKLSILTLHHQWGYEFTAFNAGMLWKSDIMWMRHTATEWTGWTETEHWNTKVLLVQLSDVNVNYKSMFTFAISWKSWLECVNFNSNISHLVYWSRFRSTMLLWSTYFTRTNTIQQRNQIILISLEIFFFIQPSYHVCQRISLCRI